MWQVITPSKPWKSYNGGASSKPWRSYNFPVSTLFYMIFQYTLWSILQLGKECVLTLKTQRMTVSRTQSTVLWNLQNSNSNGKAHASSSPKERLLFANRCGPKRNKSPEVSTKVPPHWICSKLPVLEIKQNEEWKQEHD